MKIKLYKLVLLLLLYAVSCNLTVHAADMSASEYINTINQLFENEVYDVALDNANLFVKNYPTNEHAYGLRGAANMRRDNYEEAVVDFTKAISYSREPMFKDYYILQKIKCMPFLKISKEEKLSEFNKISPDTIYKVLTTKQRMEYFSAKAILEFDLKMYAEAIQDCTKAIEAKSDILAYFYRGLSYKELNQKDLAKKDFATIIAICKYNNDEACSYYIDTTFELYEEF